MNKVFLLLGGNVGERSLALHRAERYIENKVGNIISSSSVYETEAWGKHDQTAFLNKVIEIETELKAKNVLETILHIEKLMGRNREGQKWHERIIDIDILFYNDEVINEKDLIVPHPYLHERKFTLIPLAEIAGNLIHPVFKKSVTTLLSECSDPLEVKITVKRDI